MRQPATHPSADYAVTCEVRGSECHISLSGRITIDSSPDLLNLLLSRFSSVDCQRVSLEFQNVSYIDTSGLAVLVELLKAAHALNKSLQLSGLQERPRYLLESTGVLSLFDGEQT